MLLPGGTNDDPVNIRWRQSEPHLLTRQAGQYTKYLETCLELTIGTGRKQNRFAPAFPADRQSRSGCLDLGSRVVEFVKDDLAHTRDAC